MATWTEALAVGHPAIDRQHRELFARADRLLDAMRDRRAVAEVEDLLRFLQEYTVSHFGAEERLMLTRQSPGLAAHRRLHAEFERRLRAAIAAFRVRGPTAHLILEVKDLVRNWLVDHVSTVDMEVFLREAQPGAPGAGSPSGRPGTGSFPELVHPATAQNSARSRKRPPR
jgi:hemerythrin